MNAVCYPPISDRPKCQVPNRRLSHMKVQLQNIYFKKINQLTHECQVDG